MDFDGSKVRLEAMNSKQNTFAFCKVLFLKENKIKLLKILFFVCSFFFIYLKKKTGPCKELRFLALHSVH